MQSFGAVRIVPRGQIDGKLVMQGRRMLTFDQDAVLAEAEEMVRSIPVRNRRIYDAWKKYLGS